jgi:hypothetical protein
MLNQGMNIKHPKKRGEWAEMRFMSAAAEHGLTVTRPWGDSSRYDFASEYRGCFHRIQVKTTAAKQYNSYVCNLRTGRGKTYSESEIDFLAAYIIPVDAWYILPVDVAINYHSNIILSPHLPDSKHAQYREAWHLLRQQRPMQGPSHPGLSI